MCERVADRPLRRPGLAEFAGGTVGNLAMYTVAVAAEAGETSEALRLADGVDITTIPSLERRTTHLYQVARCHERRGNDTAVLVHLQMAHKRAQCLEDFRYKPRVPRRNGATPRYERWLLLNLRCPCQQSGQPSPCRPYPTS